MLRLEGEICWGLLWGMFFAISSLEIHSSPWLKKYFEQSLAINENYLKAKSSWENEKTALQKLEDRFVTKFSFEPTVNWQEQEQVGNLSKNEYSLLKGELTQETPWGLRGTLGAQHRFNEAGETSGEKSQQYLSLWMPLWKNFMGAGEQLSLEAQRGRVQAEYYNFLKIKQSVCGKAFQTYLTYQKGLSFLKIYERSQDNARQTFSLSQRYYRQRLIKKIDYLHAEQDFARSKKETLVKKMEWEKIKADFLFLSSSIPSLEVRERALIHQLLNDSLKNSFVEKSFSYKSLQAESLAAEKSLQSSESQLGDDLNFILSMGQSESLFNVVGGVSKIENRYLSVGVRWEVDLFSDQVSLALDQERRNHQTTLDVLMEQKKHLVHAKDKLRKDLATYEKLLEAIKSEKEVSRKQQQEAYRMMKNAKIDFRDYVNYRQSYLSSEQELIETEYQYSLKKIQLSEYNGDEGQVCWGVL